MNLTSPSQVKAWCIANDFHPNRTLGQNFLVDRNALVAIVDAGLGAGAAQGVRVLEVGPGLGVLTEEMLRRGAMVTAVEKDPVLAARLAESLGNPPGLTVVEGDALDVAAGRGEFAMQPGGFDFMVSNLPYQSGTRILLELVTRRAVPSMTVLVQAEVAARLAAGPGSKTRSLAGVWAQLDYDVRVVRKVSPSCFRLCSNARLVKRRKKARISAERPAFLSCRTRVTTAEPTSGRGQKQLGDTLRTTLMS